MMSDSNHQKRMQRKKMHIDERIKAADISRGVVVVLTGNGKGKSSSAFGMVCRALGYDMQVVVGKFLKGMQQSGEDLFFTNQPNIKTFIMPTGFTWDSQDKLDDAKKARATWALIKPFLADAAVDLVVLDELTYMTNYGYLDEAEVIETIRNRPAHQHVVITGRAASKSLCALADTVADIQNKKHAFDQNIKAQKGIDL